MVVTHDGRLVTETAEVARDEFAWRLAQRATAEAGEGWRASVTIAEMPSLHAAHADEFGWREQLSLAVQLFPPTGAATSTVKDRVGEEMRRVAKYRTAVSTPITVVVAVAEVATPLPGSQTYVTVAGDTLASISTAFFGSPQHWRLISDANPGVDPALPAGTRLTIPPKP
jgi:LysM repeat protein